MLWDTHEILLNLSPPKKNHLFPSPQKESNLTVACHREHQHSHTLPFQCCISGITPPLHSGAPWPCPCLVGHYSPLPAPLPPFCSLLSSAPAPIPDCFQSFLREEALDFFCSQCHKQISRLEDLSTRLNFLEMTRYCHPPRASTPPPAVCRAP